MNFIDTHTHLFWEQFDRDIDQVVNRAKQAGVYKVVVPNVDLGTIDKMLTLSGKYEGYMFPALGLHPSSVKGDFQDVLEKLFSYYGEKKFCAIGEIGLDYYWDTTFVNEQKEAFRWQVRFAKTHNLPVIIHTRDSFDDAIDIIEQEKDENLKGVFHCFTGTKEQAGRIFALEDFYIGIGGVLTFKNSKLRETVKDLPVEKMVLETDSPFLTPHPYRGQRNESSYIPLIASKLAEVLGLPLETIAKITTGNAESLFSI